MVPRLCLAATAWTAICAALHVPTGKRVVHEARSHTDQWTRRHTLDGDVVLPMRIGLTQSNLDNGPDLLMKVSDPESPTYGQYYTEEEVIDLFAPRSESVKAVQDWLLQAGVRLDDISLSTNKQWLQFDLNAEKAGELLSTTYHVYQDSLSNRRAVGCDKYRIPEALRAHIDYITPAVKLLGLKESVPSKGSRSSRKMGKMRRASWEMQRDPDSEGYESVKSPSLPAACQVKITPQCIMSLYNVTPATSAEKGNELGIYELDGEYVDSVDLDLYFHKFYPTIPNGTFPIVHTIDNKGNVNNVKKTFTEILDFEVSYPIIWPQNSVLFLVDDQYYSENPKEFPGFFNTLLDGIDGSYCNYTAFGETGDSPLDPQYPDPHKGQQNYHGKLQCGVWKPTNVISISYAFSEITDGLPRNYLQRQCSEYMKLGMRGITVVTASGDDGVASGALCGKGEGSSKSIPCNLGCIGEEQLIFNPNFPNTCPWILSIGATALSRGPKANSAEHAWSGSGGGFSNIFTIPSYQKAAVEEYFKSPAGPKYPYYTGSSYGNGVYNRSGRGVPDVAAIGLNVPFFEYGDVQLISGTSVATPVVAAILTRINDERLAAGKSTIGFVNPVLYANPHALNDITQGTNPGCNVTGFNAGTGWDAVSGLGTPNYKAMLDVFMKLP